MTLPEKLFEMWRGLIEDSNRGEFDRRRAAHYAHIYKKASMADQGEVSHLIHEHTRKTAEVA